MNEKAWRLECCIDILSHKRATTKVHRLFSGGDDLRVMTGRTEEEFEIELELVSFFWRLTDLLDLADQDLPADSSVTLHKAADYLGRALSQKMPADVTKLILDMCHEMVGGALERVGGTLTASKAPRPALKSDLVRQCFDLYPDLIATSWKKVLRQIERTYEDEHCKPLPDELTPSDSTVSNVRKDYR